MKDIKVSVFLTTYNWSEALSLAVKSLWEQTILPNEIIIADDGSGQETKDKIELLKKESPIPIVHVWQEDKGYRINHIRNLAIKHASHPYIIQLDGDIISERNFIKDHLQFAKEKRFVVGRRFNLSEAQTIQLMSNDSDRKVPKLFRNKPIAILHQVFFCKKTSIKGVRGCNIAYWKKDAYAINGYDEDMESKGPNDKEFATRLINLGLEAYDLKFYACCHHLYHGEEGMRTNYNMVKNILLETTESKLVRCTNGLEKL